MRVHNLEGAVLDFWAAQAAGIRGSRVMDGTCMIACSEPGRGAQMVPYRPSSSWSDGGPILEREGISIWRYPDLDSWHAGKSFEFVRDQGITAAHYYQGPTVLVAAMRCFIASKLGNEVPHESGSH
jgi:hypothetical protein